MDFLFCSEGGSKVSLGILFPVYILGQAKAHTLIVTTLFPMVRQGSQRGVWTAGWLNNESPYYKYETIQ